MQNLDLLVTKNTRVQYNKIYNIICAIRRSLIEKKNLASYYAKLLLLSFFYNSFKIVNINI
jgi:hypothetical protein